MIRVRFAACEEMIEALKLELRSQRSIIDIQGATIDEMKRRTEKQGSECTIMLLLNSTKCKSNSLNILNIEAGKIAKSLSLYLHFIRKTRINKTY